MQVINKILSMPCPACNSAGQMTFATDKLLASKGVDRAKADAPWSHTELLVRSLRSLRKCL